MGGRFVLQFAFFCARRDGVKEFDIMLHPGGLQPILPVLGMCGAGNLSLEHCGSQVHGVLL